MIIEFGALNYKYFIIFLFPFFYTIRLLIPSSGNSNQNPNPFFELFLDSLARALFGIIYLISVFLSKSKSNKVYDLNKSKMQMDKNVPLKAQFDKLEKLKKIEKRHDFLDILLISIILLLADLILNFYRKNESKQICQDLSILFELFFYIGFSTIFLNFTLYSHQYVSLSIILFSHIIIFTQSIKNQKDKSIINTFQSFLYIFTISKLFCLSDVLGKKYLNVYMDGIYLFLSKIGIICLIPLIIYDTIAFFWDLVINIME